ncbi:MAG TPA: N-formylglutamate amidohydrolase [Burkholderiaceae bacterium]|jgi:N-formylglutamate deformylase|nr:N-formylglutamate amidohydrolase [Burkholderiaceae bacterium]
MKFADSDFEPYRLVTPSVEAIPLVCDSPHSGSTYPADFQTVLPVSVLRWAEDAHVDELWNAVPRHGGTLLCAEFPRSYVDVNREIDDIDPNLLAEPWTSEVRPTEKSRLGYGLFWHSVNGRPMYDRKLWVGELENRISTYYEPYHAALWRQINSAVEHFGMVWHLNLHSMPSNSYVAMQQKDKGLADFVLGDRDGTTCDPTLTGIIEDYLTQCGYSVARNDPFKGVALVARIGQPSAHRHSLQIELNRRLYMNEETFEKSADFSRVQRDLDGLCAHLREFIRGLL